MHDTVYVLQRPIHELGVAYVSFNDRETVRKGWCVTAVHLTLEAVEDDDLIAAGKETLDQVGADESGTARY
jgi:hypothetical protein